MNVHKNIIHGLSKGLDESLSMKSRLNHIENGVHAICLPSPVFFFFFQSCGVEILAIFFPNSYQNWSFFFFKFQKKIKNFCSHPKKEMLNPTHKT
jgi:hypothetical protein